MSDWDSRYQTEEYVFGTEPNVFIARIIDQLPADGKALDLATGEGRNGIFLAEHGFDVEGVDVSAVGLEKADKLAREKAVAFKTRLEDITIMAMPDDYYAVICSVFCHFVEPVRTQMMQKIVSALAPGGMFAGVFYHPNQIDFGTGGPNNPDMLATLEQLQLAADGLEWLIAEHIEHELDEGSRHKGMSSVVYLLGRKPLV